MRTLQRDRGDDSAPRQSELTELEWYELLTREKDREYTALRRKLRQLAGGNQLADLCLPVGGVLIGLTASLFDRGHWILGLLMLLIGTVLIGGRLWQKSRRRTD